MSDTPPRAGMKYFSRVKEAREVLKNKAADILEMQIAIIQLAIAKGDFETAAKANQFLLEHMPEEDGERMIEISVDKPKQVEKGSGPHIQIGFALGGIPASQGALPEAPVTIDVTPTEVEDDDE